MKNSKIYENSNFLQVRAGDHTEGIVKELYRKLEDKSLVDTNKNGALVCDAIVFLGLQVEFRAALDAYIPALRATI